MPGQAGAVNKYFTAEGAFLWNVVVLTLLVPIEVALSWKDFPAMAEQLLRRLNRPHFKVDSFVFGQVAVTLECFATHVAG